MGALQPLLYTLPIGERHWTFTHWIFAGLVSKCGGVERFTHEVFTPSIFHSVGVMFVDQAFFLTNTRWLCQGKLLQ